MHLPARWTRRLAAGAVLCAAVGGASGCGPAPREADHEVAAVTGVPPLGPADALQVRRTRAGYALTDQQGQRVQLLGVGVNAFVDYGRTGLAPTPLTAVDAPQMAALGLTSVRLAVSWSRVMPRPGVLGTAELERVNQTVETFGRHGIYTTVSLHSDRYAADLGRGTEFDGAPAWAVRTAGAPCGDPGPAYYTPCAAEAAARFYRNEAVAGRGLVDWYAQAAAALAAAAARGGAGFAGLDLINEPTDPTVQDPARPSAAWLRQLHSLQRLVAQRVRAQVPNALLWLQPQGPRSAEPHRASALPNGVPGPLVYAPHAYVDTFGTQPGERTRGRLASQYRALSAEARTLGAALVIGEFPGATGGPWDALRRAHRLEQTRREIGAITWLWKQPDAGYGWGLIGQDGSLRGDADNVRVLAAARVLRGSGVRVRRAGGQITVRWTAGARSVELWLGSTLGEVAPALSAVRVSGPVTIERAWITKAQLGDTPASGIRIRLRLPEAAGSARVALAAPTGDAGSAR